MSCKVNHLIRLRVTVRIESRLLHVEVKYLIATCRKRMLTIRRGSCAGCSFLLFVCVLILV